MTEFNAADVFLTLLIGVGPVKVLIVYLASTATMTAADRRRVAVKTVTVAGVVSVGLLVFGALVIRVLHVSSASVSVAGGIILLVLAVTMVTGQGSDRGGAAEVDPDSIAVFPLALPLTLNPVGIVALITFSGSFATTDVAVTAGLLAGVLAIDLVVLLVAARTRPLNPQVVQVAELILGFLLAALAVDLILGGLSDLGVITLTH